MDDLCTLKLLSNVAIEAGSKEGKKGSYRSVLVEGDGVCDLCVFILL